MIIEHKDSSWMTSIQYIVNGQCFYYGNDLYVKVAWENDEIKDSVVCLNFSDSTLKLFPLTIEVIPVDAKVVVSNSDSASHLKLVQTDKFDKKE